MITADSCNATSSSASVITHSPSQIKAFPSPDGRKKIVPDEILIQVVINLKKNRADVSGSLRDFNLLCKEFIIFNKPLN